MINKKLLKKLRSYKKNPALKKYRPFLIDFAKTMVYRTTKGENPKTTRKMVEKAFSK